MYLGGCFGDLRVRRSERLANLYSILNTETFPRKAADRRVRRVHAAPRQPFVSRRHNRIVFTRQKRAQQGDRRASLRIGSNRVNVIRDRSVFLGPTG